MKQITIYDLLPLLKKGWVAMDEDGTWVWYDKKPCKRTDMLIWGGNSGDWRTLPRAFNIAPFDGDWKDSLLKVGK